MTDTYGDAWTSGSSVEFKVGETSFGSYRLSSGRSTQVTLSFDPLSLVITSDYDCVKIQERGWKSITVNSGRCNNMKDDLFISNNPCLQSIVLKRNTLKYLNSFVISNNPQLTTLTIEDGTYYSDTNIESVGAFVNNVEISSIF